MHATREHPHAALRRTIERRSSAAEEQVPDFVDTVLETGKPFMALPDRHARGHHAPDEQQLLAAPVVARGETVGVVAVTRTNDEPLNGDDLELLTQIAEVTALAVGRGLEPVGRAAPERLEALAHALDSAADAIFVLDDDGCLLSSNVATTRLLGYTDRDLVGRSLREIVADGSGTRRRSDLPEFGASMPADLTSLYEIELRRDDGTVITVELSFGRINPSEQIRYVTVGRDISRRKRAEERLRREATVDPLTGLINRASLHRALGRSLSRVDAGRQLAVLFVDLDGFKTVNDTGGHQAGDEVLRLVAERLTECVRRDDLVARYGGDEFVILLESDQHIEAEVDAVCSRIDVAFRTPFAVESGRHGLGASIGCAVHGRDGTTISQLLAHADADMYRHKVATRAAVPAVPDASGPTR
jgi:diguanylate cyclase (GGDEF)-like protein/PAS domain S-box-containing protein